jgi:hypothetical protein
MHSVTENCTFLPYHSTFTAGIRAISFLNVEKVLIPGKAAREVIMKRPDEIPAAIPVRAEEPVNDHDSDKPDPRLENEAREDKPLMFIPLQSVRPCPNLALKSPMTNLKVFRLDFRTRLPVMYSGAVPGSS